MTSKSKLPRPLSPLTLLLLAAPTSTLAAATTYPAIIEFNLVFPRNNASYAPTPIFPFVFAIQNLPAASEALHMTINWYIDQLTPSPSLLASGIIDMDNHLPSTTTIQNQPPYLAAAWAADLPRGQSYSLLWQLQLSNCSTPYPNGQAQLGSTGAYGTTHFTVAAGNGETEQEPRLAMIMNPEAGRCESMQGHVVEIAETLVVPAPRWDVNGGRALCAVLANKPPSGLAGNPCAAVGMLDEAVVGRLAATWTAEACAADPAVLGAGLCSSSA
ncbi:hypothetical protein B0T19DRAFT_457607 [Cercophora scortea]|uniref:DUF7136 domain-containing protein n=1 Tax=Cercophora scortea TaxID=314031 RepID=A0AAE0IY66_9PEZI|nr:hypothetical protein B0T19DRAFT_457607 [Cercophora scortea]